ncbi:hypothetical protein A2870_04295 [Candidatus Curtissbacteria bacterium RIFCSPHIGHO2_01_FULL_41_11]|uniref:Uncharacterized protein n=1 Tax=Candidatus Curtissbacteria bacterium RIFCSPHIGHO2_01_FULL_41_11 TaxID=1797711 RepID=A0A1F5G500_9BACT|nr:MAG: hypothetical protein A2870_04295 [Candidatus Curtissbacteria bacterium RIFCSPHIGHO2_01_FULL_41_11]
MSPDRNPGIKPHRNRSDDVVKEPISVRDGIKGTRRLIPSIHIEPDKNLVMTAETLASLESLVQNPSSKTNSSKKNKHHGRGHHR